MLAYHHVIKRTEVREQCQPTRVIRGHTFGVFPRVFRPQGKGIEGNQHLHIAHKDPTWDITRAAKSSGVGDREQEVRNIGPVENRESST